MDHYLLITETFSFEVLTLTAIAVLIFTILFVGRRLSNKNGEKKLYHPVAGNKLNHFLNFHRVHDYGTDLSCEYRTFRILSPFRNEIFTSDPVIVEYILKTKFQNYGKGMYNYSILSDLVGDGIFAVDGDKWRDQRKVAIHELSTKVQKEFSTAVFHRYGVKLANIVSENATSNLPMDIQDLFMKTTLDSMVEIAFGIELDSLCGSSEEGTSFANAFDDSNETTIWRYVDISWKIKRFLNIGSEARLKKNLKVMDAFVYKLIRGKTQQIANSASQDNSSMRRHDILSRFIDSNTTIDPKYLRDIVLNFAVAGRDTTATALSWFFYMLCKHPDIQEKVAEEIRVATKMKDNMTFEELAATVTDEALDKMQYLHSAITETLRLHPAVPMDAKICLSDDTFPDGFSVRKGDVVTYLPYAMGRMEFIWGDDAKEFRPERWLNGQGIFQSESPFRYTAFQAGPRICLGKEFAYREMKIFSAILLGFFKFKLSDETKVVKYRTMITLKVDGGLHLRAFHRFPYKISTGT